MSNGKSVGIVVTILGLMLSGCDVRQGSDTSLNLKEIQQQQDIQSKRLDDLERKQKQVISNQQVMVKSIRNIDQKQKALEFTEFDPTQTRYFILNNGSMALAGRILGIAPTEDGSIVRLSLVNLLSVPVSNIGLQVTWGGAKPANEQEAARWQQLLFSKVMNSNLLLLPGKWLDVNLTLKGISPNNLRYLKMSIDMEKIVFDNAVSSEEGKVKPEKSQKNNK